MRKTFLCTSIFSYMTNFFCTRIGTLSLYITRSNPIYIQRSFSFFSNAHLWFIQKFLYIHSLFTHTRISLHIYFIKTLLCTFTFFLIWVFVVVWLVKGCDLFVVLEGVVGFAVVAVVLGFGVAVVGTCQNQ